jgi:hypothetical protein
MHRLPISLTALLTFAAAEAAEVGVFDSAGKLTADPASLTLQPRRLTTLVSAPAHAP